MTLEAYWQHLNIKSVNGETIVCKGYYSISKNLSNGMILMTASVACMEEEN